MSQIKHHRKALPILIIFVLVTIGLMTPALAYPGYSQSTPAPPGPFTTPAMGQTILIGSNYRPNLEFLAPSDPAYASYFSHFEIQYYINNAADWSPCTYVWGYSSTGSYMTGEVASFYQPYGTLVRFRVRTVSKSQAVSSWVYSGYYKRNTPVSSSPVLSITPAPADVCNCYDSTVQLSWPPCPTDVDGQAITYQVELGTWDGERYDYMLVAETTNTALEYDISQSSIYITPVPAVDDGQQFSFRIRATDGVDYTPYTDISGLVKVSAFSNLAFPENNTFTGNENVISFYGTVESSIVSAEVTLNTCFVIDPNATDADSRFISPEIRIRNLSSMPVEISILSCKATGNAPKIVAPDTFSPEQWTKLGLADSKSFISLGLEGNSNGSFWFEDEACQEEHSLGIFSASEESGYALQARFGLAWKEQENFKYDLVFEIRLVQ